MKRWIACGVALAWGFGFSLILVAKEYRKEPAEVVVWPLPWAKGISLDYDESSEHILEIKGVGNRIRTTGVTRIGIVSADATGFVQSWTSLASDTRYEKVSDEQQRFLQDLQASLGTLPLEVRLAPDGTCQGIANMDDIQSRFSAVVKPRFEALLNNSGAKPMPAGIRTGLQNVFSAYTAKPVLEMQLSVLPTAYNFVSKGGIGLDYEYKYEDEAASPLGGEPFPMTGRMTLHKDELHDGWLMMEWSVGIDREKGGEILAAAARKLLGEAFIAEGGKPVQEAIAQMRSNIDIGSSTRFRIDPTTGVVQWMQVVQRKRVGDRNDVRTVTLTLRKDGDQAGAAIDTVTALDPGVAERDARFGVDP